MRLLTWVVGGSSPAVIDARRKPVWCLWVAGTLLFLIFIDFFIAISRAVVNHDGHEGTAPDPMVWSAGAHPKRRRLVHALFLPGPPGIWDSEWV